LLALLLERRRAALVQSIQVGVGAAIGVLPLLIYNQMVFGNVLGPHVLVHVLAEQGAAPLTLSERFASYATWAHLLLLPAGQPLLRLTVPGMLVVLVASLVVRGQAARRRLGWVALGLLLGAALGVSLFRPGQFQTALVITVPAVLLGLVPAYEREQHSHAGRLGVLLLRFALVFALLCWIARLPDGGAQWGPRLLLPIIPLLVLVGLQRVAGWFERPETRAIGVGLVGAAFLLTHQGILSELEGLRQLRAFNASNHAVLTTVAQSGERVIITDVVYAPYLLAQIFYEDRLIYRVDSGAELDALLAQLEQHNIHSFYYLGIDRERISADSSRWATLQAHGEPRPLPHRLSGQAFTLP
jgi:hypothetical protein